MKQSLPSANSHFRNILCALFTFACITQSLDAQTWVQRNDFPAHEGGDGSVVFTIGRKIYVGGGFGTKKFFEYDIDNNTWLQKADLPGVLYSRCFGTGFAIGGKGYVGLGLDISQAFGAYCRNDMWEYNPVADAWLQKSSFPGDACDGHFSFVLDGIAYIGGGEHLHGPSQDEFFAFDPVADTWTRKANYPIAPGITSPFSYTVGGIGYVSCGMQTDGDVVSESRSTFSYNPQTDEWTPRADFAGANRQAGVSFTVNDRIYCGWGFQDKGAGNYYNDFFEYNADNDTWTKAFESSAPGRGFASAICAQNGSVYLGIGWHAGNVFYDWHELQFQATSMTSDPDYRGEEVRVRFVQSENCILLSDHTERYSYSIYNSTGTLVLGGESTAHSIDVRSLPAGLYVIQVSAGNMSARGLFFRTPYP